MDGMVGRARACSCAEKRLLGAVEWLRFGRWVAPHRSGWSIDALGNRINGDAFYLDFLMQGWKTADAETPIGGG